MEQVFFKDKTVLFERLEPFGFSVVEDGYYYRRPILEGQLLVEIVITHSGQLLGKVVDVDMGEEYHVFRSATASGRFVGLVREAYQAILEEIAEACFCASPFRSEQANRLTNHLKQTYGDEPDYPFAQSQTASFRVPANRKWYALLLPLNRQKLEPDGRSEDIDVLNIKVEPSELSELLLLDGIYPAYHMAKGTWVSVVLDDTVSDQVLRPLVAKSRCLVSPKGYQQAGQADYWIIPANPKYYDIAAEFAQSSRILWTQKAAIKAGDRVVIYMTAPDRCLRYLCQVLQANLSNDGYRDREDIKTLMELELIRTFTDADFPIERLKSLGVSTVRGPRRVTKALYEALVDCDNQIGG